LWIGSSITASRGCRRPLPGNCRSRC
jgi:hypothetical protein